MSHHNKICKKRKGHRKRLKAGVIQGDIVFSVCTDTRIAEAFLVCFSSRVDYQPNRFLPCLGTAGLDARACRIPFCPCERSLLLVRVVPGTVASSTPRTLDTTPFSARPLPSTHRPENQGGLSGVAVVKSRKATLAVSPLLGARRRRASVPDKHTIRNAPVARLPFSSSSSSSVSTRVVPRRPPTVAQSPLLGRRRPKPVGVASSRSQAAASTLPAAAVSVKSESFRSSNSSLRGLEWVGSVDHDENSENETNKQSAVRTPPSSSSSQHAAFVPHSTPRAAARAAWQDEWNQRLQDQRQGQQAARQAEINRLRQQLRALRASL